VPEVVAEALETTKVAGKERENWKREKSKNIIKTALPAGA